MEGFLVNSNMGYLETKAMIQTFFIPKFTPWNYIFIMRLLLHVGLIECNI